jgi:nitroreductase
VDKDKVQQVLEAARLAPTAANRQPFKFIVIHTAGKEIELRAGGAGLYRMSWGNWRTTKPAKISIECDGQREIGTNERRS